MKRLLVGCSLVCLSASALAEFPVGKVGVRLSPVVDIERSGPGGTDDGDGNAFGFHAELGGDSLYGYADHQTSDLDIEDVDADLDETRFGVGARVTNNTGTLEARVERYDTSLEVGGGEWEDDGVGMHVGGELPLGAGSAVYGSFGFLSLDDSDGNEGRLGVRGKMSQTAEIYGEYRYLGLEIDDDSTDIDLDDFRVGLNLLF